MGNFPEEVLLRSTPCLAMLNIDSKSFLCAQPWAWRGYGPGEDFY